ncbi:MAG: CoA transferase [Vannielia sp.]|uniref:CoA transferase n=1 Tax=Vannielia sp. TaxID=2813045 RepID=UPI003B8BA9FD
MQNDRPLSGLQVIEHATGVAASQAGRLLAYMGAEVVMVEPPGGAPLRREPPMMGEDSALFAFLSAGKRSVICDLDTAEGREDLAALLEGANIFIDDTPLSARAALGLDEAAMARAHPHLIHLSVLPFGAHGPKGGWMGEEINLIHAGGEGFLLPNGLTASMFPDRAPLKIAGHFAQMQGGVVAALSALSALWLGGGHYVDASVQDSNVAVGAFGIQRFGDGSVEHRSTRSFRYGGVIECADGYVELLMLEERQWQAFVTLMGTPDWTQSPDMADATGRSARGDEINHHIRTWALGWKVEDLVAQAQELGVPMARYMTPERVLHGPHEGARGIFHPISTETGTPVQVQSLPFRFGAESLPPQSDVPRTGADQDLLERHQSMPRRATV